MSPLRRASSTSYLIAPPQPVPCCAVLYSALCCAVLCCLVSCVAVLAVPCRFLIGYVRCPLTRRQLAVKRALCSSLTAAAPLCPPWPTTIPPTPLTPTAPSCPPRRRSSDHPFLAPDASSLAAEFHDLAWQSPRHRASGPSTVLQYRPWQRTPRSPLSPFPLDKLRRNSVSQPQWAHLILHKRARRGGEDRLYRSLLRDSLRAREAVKTRHTAERTASATQRKMGQCRPHPPTLR